uniref:F-type H+-transporting ATPase subunit a n=1 Tax=uncultured prokaryote TaxID=198431 RepID=H5SPA5_9ZZZZ|nr:F-type H+-transporting ATPase subunit a [uncultured prokaryote]
MRRKIVLTISVFILTLIFSSLAFAAEEAADVSLKMWIAITSGFGIAIAAFGGAFGQAKAIAAGLEGIARNPGAQPKIFIPMIVGLALIESLVIYAWVISLVLVFKL